MTSFKPVSKENGTTYKISFVGPKGNNTYLEINDGGNITTVDEGVEKITGHKKDELLGTSFYAAPLYDKQRKPRFALLVI